MARPTARTGCTLTAPASGFGNRKTPLAPATVAPVPLWRWQLYGHRVPERAVHRHKKALMMTRLSDCHALLPEGCPQAIRRYLDYSQSILKLFASISRDDTFHRWSEIWRGEVSTPNLIPVAAGVACGPPFLPSPLHHPFFSLSSSSLSSHFSPFINRHSPPSQLSRI